MKLYFSLCACLFLLAGSSYSQQQNNTNTGLPIKNIATGSSSTQNLVNGDLEHDICVNKQFSIMFYIVNSGSTGLGNATPVNLSLMIARLNDVFKRICITFNNCGTVLIPNQNFSKWYYDSTETIVTNQYYTKNVINFFIVDSLPLIEFLHPIETRAGYSYGPSPTATSDKKELLVVEKTHLMGNNCRAPLHLMGHFFGLKDTHGEINPQILVTPPPSTGVKSKEFVDRSNCSLHGDGLCDTEADSGPLNSNATTDGKGEYYIRPTDNLMSDYDGGCRFTQMQYNIMATVALTQRFYLH